MKIKTSAGVVTLLEPDPEKLKKVNSLIQFEGPLPEKPGGADYGIIMKYEEGELMAIKQQSVDVKVSDSDGQCWRNLALLVIAIKHYVKKGFAGVLMPCVYMRPKSKSTVEVGFAYFGGAAPSDANKHTGIDLPGFDQTHGAGFSRMVITFLKCLSLAEKESGIPLTPVIDMDHRPKSLLGALVFSFLIHGKDLYSLKINPTAKDPVWKLLRSTGIKQAYALPSVPLEIS